MSVSLPTDADREARQERLTIQRQNYTFEDQEPLAPFPLMKPLSRIRSDRIAILAGLMQARRGASLLYADIREAASSVISALLPDFIEEPRPAGTLVNLFRSHRGNLTTT